jgi:hypothetical protein
MVHSADDATVQSIGKFPPAVVIMNTRPHFAPLPAILELCEALALAATYFVGIHAWATAEALLVRHSTTQACVVFYLEQTMTNMNHLPLIQL